MTKKHKAEVFVVIALGMAAIVGAFFAGVVIKEPWSKPLFMAIAALSLVAARRYDSVKLPKMFPFVAAMISAGTAIVQAGTYPNNTLWMIATILFSAVFIAEAFRLSRSHDKLA